MPKSSKPWTEKLELNGKPLESSHEVARFFNVWHGQMLHILYRAPASSRYTEFEIPKRTGGMRKISSPNGMVRELQDKLKPILQQAYDAHPAAHGFIHERSIVTNADEHNGKRWILNIDLKDFFPSINFGRVRGLFMAEPFNLGPAAATICAQICTHNNGLPQGASTSPVLSNFIATSLDKALRKLARQNRMDYSRYADDITFSTDLPVFPANIAGSDMDATGQRQTIAGPELHKIIQDHGFAINAKKVRIQSRHQRQSVTGVTVNVKTNLPRTRIRKLRAMLHAWKKFGIDNAAYEHFRKYANSDDRVQTNSPATSFRNIVYGELAFVKMVRGADDPVFLNLCAKLVEIDMTPSKFVREIAFGASNFDVFISHATEDKEDIARPISRACEKLGINAFLDEKHIAWGQSFTTKINTALGASRTVLAVISEQSVNKDWPVAEVNAALSLEVENKKKVIVVLVGDPDLTKLPLIREKNYHKWDGNAEAVANKLKQSLAPPPKPAKTNSVPKVQQRNFRPQSYSQTPNQPATRKKGWWSKLFGR